MPKRELVIVELRDGTVCRMVKKALDLFLARDQIVRFKRSGEWVMVDTARLRKTTKTSSLVSSERRAAS